MIYAGKTHDFSRDPEDWIFLDIGFSSEAKTCGLKIFGEPAKNESWADACLEIQNAIRSCNKDINLMIEAPLSVMMVWTLLPTKHAESCYTVGGNVNKAGVNHEPQIINEFGHYWH